MNTNTNTTVTNPLDNFNFAVTAIKIDRPEDGQHLVKLVDYEVKNAVVNQVDATEYRDPHTGERISKKAYLRDPAQPANAIIRPEALILHVRQENGKNKPSYLYDVYLGNVQLKQKTETDPSCMWVKFMQDIAAQINATAMLPLTQVLEYLKIHKFSVWTLKRKSSEYTSYLYSEKDFRYWSEREKTSSK